MKPEALWIIEVFWLARFPDDSDAHWATAWYYYFRDKSRYKTERKARDFPPMPLPIALEIVSGRIRPWIYVVSLGSEGRWRLRNHGTGEILPGELFA